MSELWTSINVIRNQFQVFWIDKFLQMQYFRSKSISHVVIQNLNSSPIFFSVTKLWISSRHNAFGDGDRFWLNLFIRSTWNDNCWTRFFLFFLIQFYLHVRLVAPIISLPKRLDGNFTYFIIYYFILYTFYVCFNHFTQGQQVVIPCILNWFCSFYHHNFSVLFFVLSPSLFIFVNPEQSLFSMRNKINWI